MRSSATVLVSICAAALAATAQDSAKPQMTARELFYSVPETPAAKVQPTKPQPKASVARKKAAAPNIAAVEVKKTTPAETATDTTSSARPLQAHPLPDGGSLISASERTTAPAPISGPALGLKYTILKLDGSNMEETAPGSVFHTGDRIQFSVETNGPGYLYIISRGSSGTWSALFPSAEIANGDNHIEGFHSYTMPPGYRIVFNEQTGAEKLFIVVSREPEASLENMIYSLQGGSVKPAVKPAVGEAAPQPKQLLVASNSRIDDAMVQRLENSYARDLVVERVDEKTPGPKKEKAVYVVNPSGSADSRVVADLELVHK
jgi:hypothetical protein